MLEVVPSPRGTCGLSDMIQWVLFGRGVGSILGVSRKKMAVVAMAVVAMVE